MTKRKSAAKKSSDRRPESQKAFQGKKPSKLIRPLSRGAEAAAEDDFRTFRDLKLSLWQSAVEEVVAESTPVAAVRGRGPSRPTSVTDEAVRGSVMVRSANALAAALDEGHALSEPSLAAARGERGAVATAVTCSKLALQLAWAKATGDTQAVHKLQEELTFSSCDALWAKCVERYLLYFQKNKGSIPYRSGGDYVLDVAVPNNAVVAIFGDWGTGSDFAVALLEQIGRKKPDIVFHLGDIYYSGTQTEVQNRFVDICGRVLGNTPVFSLSGNHDMYSGGAGFYWLVDKLKQRASYFCLHNDHWQFQAMDTGYNDYNPFTVSSNVTSLTKTEAAWHQERLQEAKAAGRRTVLLSHHQLFTAYDSIGSEAVNGLLLSVFKDLLDAVSIWFWGHEHDLAIYEPYMGLERGRCVGCSAIPVLVESNRAPKFDTPLVSDPVNSGQPIQLGDNGTVYNHGYAIMSLQGAKASVAYYQDTDEDNPLYVESIT